MLNLQAPKQSFTDNNGLGMTVDVLEEIYTNADFPKGTPDMRTSVNTFRYLVLVEFALFLNSTGRY